MGWLDSQAVQGAIADFARPREVKLTIHRSDDRAEDFVSDSKDSRNQIRWAKL